MYRWGEPTDYGNVMSEEDRKQLLFDVGQTLDYNSFGPSATNSSLRILRAIAQGTYYRESNKTWIAKFIESNHPQVYERLVVFFHQNAPDIEENE